MHAIQYTQAHPSTRRRALPRAVARNLRLFGAAGGAVLLAATGAMAHHLTPQEEGAWLNRLAAGGDGGAQLELGLAYRSGRDALPIDPLRSLYWLERAAQGGSAYAADQVGDAYAQGIGTAVDTGRARHWWRVAADAGNADAKRRLGETDPDSLRQFEHIVTGQVIHDQSGAALQARAAAHDPLAEFQLGERYRDGAWGVGRDPTRAQELLQRAAADGNPLAGQALASDTR